MYEISFEGSVEFCKISVGMAASQLGEITRAKHRNRTIQTSLENRESPDWLEIGVA